MAEAELENGNIWQRALNIDRRWIFLVIGVTAVVPFFFRMGLPVYTTDEVESIFDYIDELDETDAIFVAFDYQPGTMAENHPMALAVMRHAFARHVPVYMTANFPLGQALGAEALAALTDTREPANFERVAWADWEDYRESGITRAEVLEGWETDHELPDGAMGWLFEGMDYAFLGYAPVFSMVILGMGTSIATQYPNDVYGNPVNEMPILRSHKSAREVDLAVSLSGSSACTWWITYGRESYGLPIAFGVTAVMATDYYPYIQSGQVIGQMGGLRGAAEYEVMLLDNGYAVETGQAFRGMDVQSLAHIMIILFVVFGNIAYFAGGFHKKSQRLKSRR